jgi:endogenous inhibitor of DNA gyrase (YacG/DUF329 family)
MGRAGGPEHSAAIKRGLARAKERFDRKEPERSRHPFRCWHCGAPRAESYTGRQRKYCSNTCRQAAYRERWATWAAYVKEHPHRCWRCNAPVTLSRTGRPREYCSNACRQADYRDRKRWG